MKTPKSINIVVKPDGHLWKWIADVESVTSNGHPEAVARESGTATSFAAAVSHASDVAAVMWRDISRDQVGGI